MRFAKHFGPAKEEKMAEGMIEKVARAICEASGAVPDAMTLLRDRPNWQYFRHEAKAAIAAMRSPSEEMLKAGYGQHYRLDTTLGRSKAELDYDDMMRAALKQEEKA